MIRMVKIRWKKGSSLVEFALVLPALCMILFSIIVISQLVLCRQSLEHTAYLGARAAVVCDNYEDARYQLSTVVKESIKKSVFGVDDDGVVTSIALVAGTSGTTGSASSSNGITWEKGALAEITVTVSMEKALSIGPDTMSTTLYIMVERPAAIYS